MSITQVKSNLAKLLATENLTVEHSNVSTASFNVETRVLQLPVWENISNDVYDLLVGHEVGHALYTPSAYITREVPQSFLNVVEDARIERKIKLKYPGITKSFYRGYTELNKQDFFEIGGENLSEMNLIDRINLYFKLGIHDVNTIIPFDVEEEQFVNMSKDAETFDDVVSICKKILEYIESKSEKQESKSLDVSNIKEDGLSGTDQISVDVTPSDESDEMTHEEMLDEANKREKENEFDDEDFDGEVKDNDEYTSHTDSAWGKNTKTLVDSSAKEHIYMIPPTMDWSNCIEPVSMFSENMDKNIKYFEEKYETIYNVIDNFRTKFNSFKVENAKSVSFLVKEFEMKKQADEYNRSGVSKTGVLNTNKLFSYKWSDDIFKKNTIVPDGKNHGLIMYIDWSGSMADNMSGTIKQLINLIMFCKKVNIPFQVFAFSDTGIYDYSRNYYAPAKEYEIAVSQRFRLIEMFNHKIKKSEFDEQLFRLWVLMTFIDKRVEIPFGSYSLGGTPLNDTILAATYVFNKFKRETGVDKVNTVFLTDGESNNMAYSVFKGEGEEQYISRKSCSYSSEYSVLCLKDPATGYSDVNINNSKGWQDSGMNITSALLRYYKWMTGSNIVGFRLSQSHDIKYIIRSAVSSGGHDYDYYRKLWRTAKCFVVDSVGYDELYVISASSEFNGSQAVIEASHDDSKSKIRRQFKKYMKTKMMNKIILSKFVDQIA
jgi:hypothetical protein